MSNHLSDHKKVSGTHVWLVLWKASTAVKAKSLEHISSLGLGISDFAVLEVLLHKGNQQVSSLGKKVLLTSGSITTAVDRLEKKGFVERAEVTGDRRSKSVSLTATGRKFIEEAFNKHDKYMENVASTLNNEERNTLITLLKKLAKK